MTFFRSPTQNLTMLELLSLRNEFEPDIMDEEENIKFSHRVARNLLRFLLLGSPISKNGPYKKCLIAIESCLMTKKEPTLLAAMRIEMQEILNNLIANLEKYHPIPEELERQLEIFIHNFLADYPFMDPDVNSEVFVPQKYNNRWQSVRYKIIRFDMSPSFFRRSVLFEEEDNLYAYALVPVEPQVGIKSHLLLAGTTYDTGQGADLSVLYNFYPRYSPGEAQDTTEIDEWIRAQPDNSINVTGHSKGADMAMITAARHPNKIHHAACLNPTGLAQVTLNRLLPKWNAECNKNKIDVYTQPGDPCFSLQKGFLPGTRITLISPRNKQYSNYGLPCIQKRVENHIQIFAARDDVELKPINTDKENHSSKRELFGDIQDTLNWLVFPLLSYNFYAARISRKLDQFYEKHKLAISILGGILVAGACAAIASTVFLAPLAALGIAKAIAIGGSVSALGALLSPRINKFFVKLLSFTLNFVKYTVFSAISISTLLLTAIGSLIKIGLKALFTDSYNVNDNVDLNKSSIKSRKNKSIKESLGHQRTANDAKQNKTSFYGESWCCFKFNKGQSKKIVKETYPDSHLNTGLSM